MENPYANVFHLSLFHFFESLFIIVLSPSFFFKIYKFARFIASLSG